MNILLWLLPLRSLFQGSWTPPHRAFRKVSMLCSLRSQKVPDHSRQDKKEATDIIHRHLKSSSKCFIIHNRCLINLKSISVKSMEKSNRKMTNVMTLSEDSHNPTLAMPCNTGGRPSQERTWNIKVVWARNSPPIRLNSTILKSLQNRPSFSYSILISNFEWVSKSFQWLEYIFKIWTV